MQSTWNPGIGQKIVLVCVLSIVSFMRVYHTAYSKHLFHHTYTLSKRGEAGTMSIHVCTQLLDVFLNDTHFVSTVSRGLNIHTLHQATCNISYECINKKIVLSNTFQTFHWTKRRVATHMLRTIKLNICVNIPICLRVISTCCVLLTFDNNPKQNRSALEGSVKPSTVSEGCEALNVSPTRVFSS